ncbi:flagellar assembly protein FliW [Paenibacillus sp. NEAU-GSW1]|uniref:flagellar assembly protein FliW n=1 Tax=Paenibacillus sp. NEAU-GSW1 TaxID=2682486 RepID=UPI0012E0CA1E|nr:flagellar assembly protein FliW [Paenibacillus sp. NEAU-GSW1]MUT65017.1 flagellar assembly protein FliW [Paenibacillus sp. NEAU-GSW1]
MIIQTSRFGELQYEKEQIIVFEEGIPGFKEYRNYMIVSEEDSPFQYLQSLEEGALAFIIVVPFDFVLDYEFVLSEKVKEDMAIQSERDIQVYNIVNVQGDLAAATINLAAPVIIHSSSRKGLQYILPDGHYSIYHPLFKTVSAEGVE